MYFKTILIAVMAVNYFETYCQPLEQGNILKCYTSDGWHDAELNNKKTCNGEKCFGFFNFPGIMVLVALILTFFKFIFKLFMKSRHRQRHL